MINTAFRGDEMFKKIGKITVLLSIFILIFTGQVFADSHYVYDGSSLNLTTGVLIKSDGSTETLTINDGDALNIYGTVTLTGSKNVHVSCVKNVNLTLDNVTIDNSNRRDCFMV